MIKSLFSLYEFDMELIKESVETDFTVISNVGQSKKKKSSAN